MYLHIKLKNKKRRITHMYYVEGFELTSDKIILKNAFSLKTHNDYDLLEFSREDWRMI